MSKNTRNLSYLILPYSFTFMFSIFFWLNTAYYVDFAELAPYTYKETNFSIVFGTYFLIVFVTTCVFLMHTGDWDDTKYYEYLVIFTLISIALNVSLLYYSSTTLKPSDKFKKDLNNSVYHYQEQDWPLKIDRFQRESECCGYFNFTDYLNNENTRRLNHKLPNSCCTGLECTKLTVYKIGCLLSYEKKIIFHKKMIYVSSGLSISIQLFTICLILYFFDTYQVILDKDKLKKVKSENIVWINPNKN